MAGKTGELGRIGQLRWGSAGKESVFFEEFLRELQGIKGVQAYQEMADNDSTIGAILFAIEMLMRQCEFHIEPASQDKADVEAAEFVESCMDDMERTWADTLSEILSFLTYGWSYHEIVYKRRGGKTSSPITNSKYDDGLIGWRKLPIRAQDTLYGWDYAPGTDDLIGMTQEPAPDFERITIPLDKALHFRTRSRKDNPEGRSILRTAYRDWYFKKRLCEIEAYGIERDLAGFPVLYAPPEIDIWNPDDPDAVSALSRAEYIVSSIRRDAREGLVLPGKSADGTLSGWELQLLTSGSRRQFDTNAIIDRYNKQIATSVLADFVMLGQQQVGSFALADSKTKIFALAIGTYLDNICEVFNIQAIPRLIDLNGEHFKGITGYPTMEHGDIEDKDLMTLSTYLKDMIGVGLLEPDDELEDAVRRAGGLPERKDGAQPRSAAADQDKKSSREILDDTRSAQMARESAEETEGVKKRVSPTPDCFTDDSGYDIISLAKYNHNHDPASGRFTSGPGGSGARSHHAGPPASGSTSSSHSHGGGAGGGPGDPKGAVKSAKGGYFDETDTKAFTDAVAAAQRGVAPAAAWRVSAPSQADFEAEHPGAKMHITENGSTVAVSADGDIVAVCADPRDSGMNLINLAVANGGTKGDSFAGLYGFYRKAGLEPRTACEFSEEFAPPGWVKGRDAPEPIIFWEYTGNKSTKTRLELEAECDAWLASQPIYTGENGYGDAMAARDSMMNGGKST